MTDIEKFKSEIVQLMAEQKHMKNINKYFRKHRTCRGFPGLSDARAALYDKCVADAPPGQKSGPFNSKWLAQNNSQLKRLKIKLYNLQNEQMNAAAGKEGDLCTSGH